MRTPTVTIIETGVANTASVASAFARCGAGVRLVADRRSVECAELLVLPGVGAFGTGMARLAHADLVDTIRVRVCEQRPTLAICLGLQLLCRASQETPNVAGIGAIDAEIEAFPRNVRSPQFGWNHVEADSVCEFLESGYAYFANSYRLLEAPPGWHAVYSNHGGRFVVGLERGAVLACQFHPELSGVWGTDLLQRWLIHSRERLSC